MNKAECEERAKGLAANMLRASADPLEVRYAVGQLIPLYEMISEGEAEISRLEDELNRQKAKTEYEAERAGNIANSLDEAVEVIKGLLRTNERWGLTVHRRAAHNAACDFLRKAAEG